MPDHQKHRSARRPPFQRAVPIAYPKTQATRNGAPPDNASVPVCALQFGWETRDGVYSAEFERTCAGTLQFNGARGHFRLRISDNARTVTITLDTSQITWASSGCDQLNAILFFALKYPPSYHEESVISSGTPSPHAPHQQRSPSPIRRRLSSWDPNHWAYSPYTSNSIRIVCFSKRSVYTLSRMVHDANVPATSFMYPLARLDIFSPSRRDAFQSWLAAEGFEMAFQLDSIARTNIFDLQEILRLKPHLIKMKGTFGTSYTASFTRHLALQARNKPWCLRKDYGPVDSLMKLFVECKKDFYAPASIPYSDRELFFCHHVTVTPTRLILSGPFPERNNRVMRKYAAYTTNFIRVSFADEDGLQFRADPDSGGRQFVRERFGHILSPSNGLDVAGHHFDFLTHSLSGLKSHAVWFVRPFRMPDPSGSGPMIDITAASIIAGLGIFDDPSAVPCYDPDLVRCPARYAARLAQAFTATDAAVEVAPDDIVWEQDIVDAKGRSFTDGAGLMSYELLSDIWEELQRKNPRIRGSVPPDVLQIRHQGSKGTLTASAELPGRRMVLRHTMIKFAAPDIRMVEVAAVFNRPAPFYLNRPLIMVLEGLKLKGGYAILKSLQDKVVEETTHAMHSFSTASSLLDRHGLGVAYKLSSTCSALAELITQEPRDSFLLDPVDVASYHILRDLKYRAHIPVPDGYTLVGVADPYGCLEPDEVFACVTSVKNGLTFLEGPIMISRSPVSHRGDVQIRKAIGRPPVGSILEKHPVKNALVFSVKGSRPLSSCLSGGDLDGDTYVITTLEDLLPTQPCPPADYNSAKKKLNPYPSTMQDVADFITEYIYSDNVGVIASRWLEIADSSPRGVSDPACLALASLHSAAVDYPKTGLPVPLANIPRYQRDGKPDWTAPEIGPTPGKYYQSQSFIGRLFREVKLSPPRSATLVGSRPPTQYSFPDPQAQNQYTSLQRNAVEMLSRFDSEDSIETAIHTLVSKHIGADATSCDDKYTEDIWVLFQDYVSQLRATCLAFSLAQGRGMNAMLTEDEIIVGTILAPARDSRFRRQRKEQMSQMREQVSILVDRFVAALTEGIGRDVVAVIRRAWLGFRLTTIHRDAFGCRSFRLIALHEILDAIKLKETSYTTRATTPRKFEEIIPQYA
ncbi:hypothetical protein PHLGIDRAFT_313005 [Phlebiopsis gigantea 11061_1 CR5-6]|uniref:RNA-dependent RNA polymerase n=1 Tax=Phlebiopsis gigantea (strain 11061_1 CR5-6) TaxID=745531 RepID=A0A0C3PR18_PHLG1|nr:hypothetical protein PHLGIDRAFT_313005 [Phlebiopsis gigantea 11061_1 CR5-6]